jgi:phospholipid/cholesterol/gamma-HCH transport system substrate-binding protein
MKKNTSNKIGLGLFVAAALILFIIGIYYVGERQQIFRETSHITTVFRNVNGLQPGNNVRYAGIDIGIVDNIVQTNDTSVKVDMQIDDRSRRFIKKDAKASIGSDGLMGNKIIIIVPGAASNDEISNNDAIGSIAPIDMDALMFKLKATGDNLSSITGDLATIMKNIRTGKGTIGMLFTDSVFAHNLGSAIVNVKQGAQGFKQNMDAAGNSFLLRGYLKKKEKEKEKEKKKEESK